jgi:chemotaxis protein MotC
MRWQRHIVRTGLATLCFAVSAGFGFAEEGTELEPYQMVRSLQLVQDRIAAGDHAALPMQRKLLEMIDQRLRTTTSEDYADERNYQAMLVYAMSGGNPATIDKLLTRLHLDETERALGTGILGYLNGDMQLARNSLKEVDPLALTPELGAFFSLVKGSIAPLEDPASALRMFDEARLLSPGTLVEEAALRRSLPLAARNHDPARFLMASSQYVRRYLMSPYASQFADAFVAGVVALHETIDRGGIEDVVSMMDAERQKVIYLRLARRAAIEGITDLTEYASAKADVILVEGVEPGSDPRALLYSSLANVTTETVDEVLPKLKSIDRSRLSENDRKLLEAVEAIAAEITAAPAAPAQAGATAERDRDHTLGAAETPPDDQGLPEAEPIDTPQANEADAPSPMTEPAAPEQPAHAATPGTTDPASAEADAASAVLATGRQKLDEIDKLLKETTQ